MKARKRKHIEMNSTTLKNKNVDHFNDYLLPLLRNDLVLHRFTDVEIVCGSGQSRQMHKILLMLTSEFLRQLLLLNTTENELLVIPELDIDQLDMFIEGVYRTGNNLCSPTVDPSIVQLFCISIMPNMLSSGCSDENPPSNLTDDEVTTLCQEVSDNYGTGLDVVVKEETPEQIILQYVKQEKPEITNLRCNKCDKTMSSQSALQIHIQTVHHGLKPFTCDYCGHMFSQVGNLKSHILSMHELAGQRPHTCDICDKTYKTKWDMVKHKILVHDRTKVHVCEQCGKDFVCKSSMKLHIRRVHEKQREFVCGLCPKTFFQSHRLQEHLNIHNNVRPFKCLLCGHCFASRDLMKKHRSNVHEKKKSSCGLCSRIFSTKYRLSEHMKTHSEGYILS